MAGPLTIQRYPTALLALLGTQSSGDTPTELAPSIFGMLDMLDFYTRDRFENIQSAGLNLGPGVGFVGGSFLNLTPPAGEQWLVYAASAQTNGQAAATTGRYQLALYFSGNTTNAVSIPHGSKSSLAAGEATSIGGVLDRPLLFRPGDSLAMWTEAYTGAVATMWFGQMVISRLRA